MQELDLSTTRSQDGTWLVCLHTDSSEMWNLSSETFLEGDLELCFADVSVHLTNLIEIVSAASVSGRITPSQSVTHGSGLKVVVVGG